jgi:hypothetical protein
VSTTPHSNTTSPPHRTSQQHLISIQPPSFQLQLLNHFRSMMKMSPMNLIIIIIIIINNNPIAQMI